MKCDPSPGNFWAHFLFNSKNKTTYPGPTQTTWLGFEFTWDLTFEELPKYLPPFVNIIFGCPLTLNLGFHKDTFCILWSN